MSKPTVHNVNSVFEAHDKVLPSQVEFYREYAAVAPGSHLGASIAEFILYMALKDRDEVVLNLNAELATITRNGDYPVADYILYAIRDISGESFDIYLLDEDKFLIHSRLHVAENDVVKTGRDLAWSAF